MKSEPLLPSSSQHESASSSSHKYNGLACYLSSQRVEWSTWFTIICTMAGTGILQLPLTLKQGGWIGLVLIVLVAAMTNTTGKWLIKCLYRGQHRLSGYPDIGEEAFGRVGRVVVHVFHKATLLGVTTIFLILAGKFLTEGIGGQGEGFFKDLNAGDDESATWTKRWTIISAVIVAIPVISFKTIGEIAPLAAFGLSASVLCVLEIVAFCIVIGQMDRAQAENYDLPIPEDWNHTGMHDTVSYEIFSGGGFASAFAAITLSFGGHAVFPTIEKHMTRRETFSHTFDVSYLALVIMYLAAAFAGYYSFGDATYSPVLCNFPRDTSTAMGAITAFTKLVIALHVMSAYPILLVTAASEIEYAIGIVDEDDALMLLSDDDDDDSVENRSSSSFSSPGDVVVAEEQTQGIHTTPGVFKSKKRTSWKTFCYRALLRTSLVVATCSVAVFVPYFAQVMELVGALCLTMIVFVLPVLFTWKLQGSTMSWFSKFWGLCIVVAGITGGTIGSIQAVSDIVSKLKSGDTQ